MRFFMVMIVMLLVLSACSLAAAEIPATPTVQATATKTLVPTKTSTPTRTPLPTRTPNLAATQRFEDYTAEVQKYLELGYIKSAEGRFVRYDDFNEEWAQLRWYQWWTMDDKAENFFMSAHFKWSSAYRNADVSGCGFVFAIQENGDHFAVFLDRSLIRFLNSDQSSYTRRMGVTRGTGRVDFNNPADQPVEADFTIIVNGTYVYVLVDGEVVGEYSLPQNRILEGNLGLTLLSGTNKDYGTRCEMTNIHAWIPND
jgi:hypothetical protein